jgi:nickel/cobalt exporter
METLLTGSALLSLFHALIPSHWLPVVAIGRQQEWSPGRVLGVTFLAGLAHVLSTVLIGIGLAALGGTLNAQVRAFSAWIAPAILMAWGAYYIYEHYRHHHFHLHRKVSGRGLIASLAVAMFFSPCLEIEGYFLAAGPYGWAFVGWMALVYGTVTIAGMLIWVRLALTGLQRLNWHAWEHNAGLITGLTLLASGAMLILSA